MATKEESEQWLNKFIKEHSVCWETFEDEHPYIEKCKSISDLIIIVEEYLENNKPIDGWCFANDEVDVEEFRLHYENYTGKKMEPETEYDFIQCCC